MEWWQAVVLVPATLGVGLNAGLFYTWSHTVMPALAAAGDREFVDDFQRLDRAVINPWFLTGFLAGPVLTGVALVLQLLDEGPGRWWLVAGLVLQVAVLGITRAVHLPLNAEIQAAGDPAQLSEPRVVRARFEGRWVRWNVVRTVASVAGFGCLLVALVLVAPG